MSEKEDDIFSHDWYKILSLEYTATEEEIATAGRKLSAKYHPDKNKSADAPAKFLLIQRAKNTLTDPEKRKEIDSKRNNAEKRKAYESKREQEMDASRKKRRDDLEQKVRAEAAQHTQQQPAYTQSDLETLRKLSAQRREEATQRSMEVESDRLRQLQKELKKQQEQEQGPLLYHVDQLLPNGPWQLKLKWKTSRCTHENDESLMALFNSRGLDCRSVEHIALQWDDEKGKINAALVTFSDRDEAVAALNAFSDTQAHKEADCYRLSIAAASMAPKAKKAAAVFSHVFSAAASQNTGLNSNNPISVTTAHNTAANVAAVVVTAAELAAQEDDVFALAALKRSKKKSSQPSSSVIGVQPVSEEQVPLQETIPVHTAGMGTGDS